MTKEGPKSGSVLDIDAWFGSLETALANSDVVKSSGAVSPAARAIASVVPVRIPL